MNLLKSIITSILWFESRLVLVKYKPEVIAVTGSVGKTSTKDAIFEVLKSASVVRKSPKSYNSEFGMPLAILGRASAWHSLLGWVSNIFAGLKLVLKKVDYPKTLILEAGADKPGDIEKAAKFLNPCIVVITAIGEIPAHVEFFGGPAQLAREKAKLLSHLGADDWAVLNTDDSAVLEMRRDCRGRILTYGFGEDAQVRASDYKIMITKNNVAERPEGITFKLSYDGAVVPIRIIGAFGKPQVYAALAAAACGIIKGMNLVEISEALSRYQPPAGRTRILDGIKSSMIIDDSYNASPAATHAALDLLRDLSFSSDLYGRAGRKIAVLGDMLELGELTEEAHRRAGRQLREVNVLITVGFRAKFIADEAKIQFLPENQIHEFPDSASAADWVVRQIKPGDLILIKGSQAMRMERITEAIMVHPEKAAELLVRQEKEWKAPIV